MNTIRTRCLRPAAAACAVAALLGFAPTPGLRAADAPPRPAAIADALRGRLAVQKNGALTGLPDSEAAGKKFYALYFSAGWCPPCHTFTPKLVAFYQAMKPKHAADFEVIFISDDHSENEQIAYMRELAMPWPALRFWALKSTPNLTRYGGKGIPRLVLVDAAGNVLSDSFVGENYVGPERVMTDLQARLSAASASR
jgi:nucleoredoxin